MIADYDLVLDGRDRLATRYVVNDACVLGARALVSAAVHRFEGQLFTYVPGRGPCYRCLFPHAEDGVVANCAQAGVLGVLPGVLGTLQATEALKLITGSGEPLLGRLLTYDALAMRFRELRARRRSDCAVCGDTPSITEPKDAKPMSRSGTPEDIRRLSVADLATLLRTRADAPPLIDVREVHEFDAGHLAGSVNIPLGTLPQRLHELAGRTPRVHLSQRRAQHGRLPDGAGGEYCCACQPRGRHACVGRADRPDGAGHLKTTRAARERS